MYPVVGFSAEDYDEETGEDEVEQRRGQAEEELQVGSEFLLPLSVASETKFFQMRKKDLESLVHQADPSLTVKQLPPEPEISSRKFLSRGEEDEAELRQRRVR